MSQSTLPIFVASSGRSGTRMVSRLLAGIPDLEVHHEYVHTQVQKVACLYAMGLLTPADATHAIRELHGGGVYYSSAARFVDASNKVSWVIDRLAEIFPPAKFVHLIRDGRKVVSSFFNKLSDEIYPDTGVAALQAWIADRRRPMPPPEKKYWWKIPQGAEPYADRFGGWSQFQRICYHWQEVNGTIARVLTAIPEERKLTIKLEDLVSRREAMEKFLAFFGLPYEERFSAFVQKPDHVFFPLDFKLTPEQSDQFNEICGTAMRQFGYSGQEYNMKY